MLYLLSWTDNENINRKIIECFYWLKVEYEWITKFASEELLKKYSILEMSKFFDEITCCDQTCNNYFTGRYKFNKILL